MSEIPVAPVVRILKDAGAERISDDAKKAFADAVEAAAEELAKKVKKSFLKFYNEKDKCLYDVIEPNDASIRPNQIWAVSLT